MGSDSKLEPAADVEKQEDKELRYVQLTGHGMEYQFEGERDEMYSRTELLDMIKRLQEEDGGLEELHSQLRE
ncbi:hypothetical protein [Halorarum halobium]|uniref:hypothetical protein n=1 Tax=Halorarum halobium TaxID=3075121 RepID=UPI0028A9AF83|nr:hypothetical protein [Halobaculum sp. XH14]